MSGLERICTCDEVLKLLTKGRDYRTSYLEASIDRPRSGHQCIELETPQRANAIE